MPMIGAKAFAVGGEPGADYLVFGTGEEDVAVFSVSMGKESGHTFLWAGSWGQEGLLDLS